MESDPLITAIAYEAEQEMPAGGTGPRETQKRHEIALCRHCLNMKRSILFTDWIHSKLAPWRKATNWPRSQK